MLISTILICVPVSIHCFSPPQLIRSIRLSTANNYKQRIDGIHDVSQLRASRSAAEAAEAIDPSKLKVVELKDRLRELNLPLSGNKSELVERLSEHYRLLSTNTNGGHKDDDDDKLNGNTLTDDDDDDDDDDDSTTTITSTASWEDLEALEEERLAKLEEEEAALSKVIHPKFTAPSNLYTGIYDSDQTNGNNNNNISIDEGKNYFRNDPKKELELAQRRDALQNAKLNEMFSEEDESNAARQAKIQQLMAEDDAKWQEERRKRLLGKYANVESWEEVEKLQKEDREKELQEINLKVTLAKEAGVTLTMLEPTDGEGSSGGGGGRDGGGASENKVDFGRATKSSSWFGPEEGLELDLPEIKGGDDVREDGPRVINGQITSREQLMGISVGSAGGWSLEVFPGDFVVHRKYGIGRYERTVLNPKTKLTPEEKEAAEDRRKEIINDLMKDGKQLEEIQRVVEKFGTAADTDPISNPLATLLEISYSDAVVHVPIERAYRLSRYRAGDAAVKPSLSRVKGEAWAKAKRKVEASTVQMAEDVLALYATRETLNRPPFDPSAEGMVKVFSKSFPFEPTPDQKKCFEDVENDMVWRSRPMDRLICGDVGFGKTEVALRALFRAVANGRQAALLAPTGVLAAQHFKQVVRRMGEETEHKFNIALLRGGMGKNTKKGRELRASIAAGDVDIIVGTHALLSNGMKFNDLGLLCIDEEQRFGVNQKERIKLICNCVDVLTLSATPIPRTLQMSLSGIRDTSTIRSPPPMRKPTISYVQEYEESLIKAAVEKELARGGQCYYVVPRISQLQDANDLLLRLFPGLRVIQAHGRMSRGAAEENVAAFAEGGHDVLLATTVIENGVDIPRVNTIIIQNAQAFGMSTLYQLRGRVGRSDLQAYAYFFHKNDAITEQSAQRLQAMADLHELGSGFDVANRDLEIRGAGSLLGTEQSGMAAKVGFDLYMRMLKKSIRQLRGLDLPVVPRTNVLLPGGEGSIEWDAASDEESASYLIPDLYIQDAKERSKQEGVARLAESTARLVEITNGWKDKYGAIPSELQNNLKSWHLNSCLRQLGIDIVGLDESTGDCILRSPGLRPRHWAMICSQLPRGAPPKGLDVVFPARFTFSTEDKEITGGKKVDLDEFISPNYADDDEEWDALDEEEVEAMKEISSASTIKSMQDVEIRNYPRFVVKKLGTSVDKGSRVDALLKVLLPPSKVVFTKQEKDKEKAKLAAELRDKREAIARQKKEQEKLSSRRLGGFGY
jgi:transcription-repair coupling factor